MREIDALLAATTPAPAAQDLDALAYQILERSGTTECPTGVAFGLIRRALDEAWKAWKPAAPPEPTRLSAEALMRASEDDATTHS